MRVPRGLMVCWIAAALAVGFAGTSAAAERAKPQRAGDTVDVEIKIVPFYAVDAEGNPVFDLKPEEVELKVGGKVVPTDTFDSYSMEPTAPKEASVPSRHVLFLFDAAFSSPRGLQAAQRTAEGLVKQVPAGDRLYLLTNDTRTGFEQKLGPVHANPKGKDQLLRAIRGITPNVQANDLDIKEDMGPTAIGSGKRDNVDKPSSQVAYLWDLAEGHMRSEYQSIAFDLADSLERLAAEMARISGPKLLLVFSQGVDDRLYFAGDDGFAVGSTDAIQMDSRRLTPMLGKFQGPLRALMDSGTQTVFVNGDPRSFNAASPLRHMATETGALYFEGNNIAEIGKRVAASTAAYYEAGVYLGADFPARAAVEVAVRRPGVKAWAPAGMRVRDVYSNLSATEKRRLVVDLVAAGPEAKGRSQVRLQVADLGGQVLSRPDAKKRQLRYQAAWPPEVSGRKMDMYNVALAPARRGKEPEVLRFDHWADAQPGVETFEVAIEKKDDLVWGLVAVDPETGRAWVRRLHLQGEKAKR